MVRSKPDLTLSEYITRYQWKRSYTELDMKRKRTADREKVRMKINVIDKMAKSTMRFELENFHLFGSLRKVEPEVHNTLPSNETVLAEKDYISFENIRKKRPHAVKYNDFYGCIRDEANKPRTPASGSIRSFPSTPASPYKPYRSLPALQSTSGAVSKTSTPGISSYPNTPLTSHSCTPVNGKYRMQSETPKSSKLFSNETIRS